MFLEVTGKEHGGPEQGLRPILCRTRGDEKIVLPQCGRQTDRLGSQEAGLRVLLSYITLPSKKTKM